MSKIILFGIGAPYTHGLPLQARKCEYASTALTDTNLCGAMRRYVAKCRSEEV